MKPEEKILTYAQARELKWFGRNCTGLRQEYYALVEKVEAFNEKLARLDKTAQAIESYFPDLNPPHTAKE